MSNISMPGSISRIELKVSREEQDEGKSIRFLKGIPEIHEYSGKDNEKLFDGIIKQSKELVVLFCLFVIDVVVGAFIFFYIEECSGATMADDGTTPSFADTTEPVKFKNLTKTCSDLYHGMNNILYNQTIHYEIAFTNYLKQCQAVLNDSFEQYLRVPKHTRSCVIDEFQVLKYAEYTTFTLLTIGYGNTTPVTIIGRYVLIIYALFGVPLAVSMYSVAGKLLIQVYTRVIRSLEFQITGKKSTDRLLPAKVLILSCVMMVVIILVGCFVTTRDDMENLSFSSSLYFWFLSLTTIGYGDIHFDRKKHLRSIHFLFISAGNLLFGLGISAAIIEAFSNALEKRQLLSKQTDETEGIESADGLHLTVRGNVGVSSKREERNMPVLFCINEEETKSFDNNWYLTDHGLGKTQGHRSITELSLVSHGGVSHSDDTSSVHSDTSYFHGSNIS